MSIVQSNQLERAARTYGDITNYYKSSITSWTLECLANGHSEHVKTCRNPSGAVEWELKMMTGGTGETSVQAFKNLMNSSRYNVFQGDIITGNIWHGSIV